MASRAQYTTGEINGPSPLTGLERIWTDNGSAQGKTVTAQQIANLGGGGGGGSFAVTPANITQSEIETATGGYKVTFCDCTTGAITVTLPSAIGYTGVLIYKKVDGTANSLTISGAQTIDGNASEVITIKNTSISLVSNGSVWGII